MTTVAPPMVTPAAPPPSAAAGATRVLGANAPLVVDDPRTAWEVLTGEADVFYVGPSENTHAQPRRFVMTLRPGDVIAAPPVNAQGGTLIVVGVQGATVRAVSLAPLFATSAGPSTPDLGGLATRIIATWARASANAQRPGPTVAGQDARALTAAGTEFIDWTAKHARVDAAAEAQRLVRRFDGERRMQSAGLAALGVVLGGPGKGQPDAGAATSPLLAACNAVGNSIGVTFHEPPEWEVASRARDPLAALCRVSRVRHRRVALRGEWWKSDSGPVLGQIAATGAWVALLPNGAAGYGMFDPATGTSVSVTEDVAATLDPFAHVFYAPGPSAPMGVREIARLATRGVRGDLGLVLLLAAATSVVGLAVPIATGKVFSAVIPNSQTRDALALLGSLLGLAVGSLLFTLARAYALIRFEGRSSERIQSAVVDRLLSLPVGFFRRYSVGELAQRAGAVSAVRDVLSGATMSSLLGALVAIANFALLFRYSWKLAMVAVGVLVIASAVIVGSGWRTIRLQRQESAIQRSIASLVFQMLGGIAKLRVAGAELRAVAVWCARFAEQKSLSYRAGLTSLGVIVFNDALPTLSILALFWAAQGLVAQDNGLDVGSFIAFNTAFGSFLAAGLSLAGTALTLLALVPTLEAASPILAATPEVHEARPDPGALSGRVEATHLTFRYDPNGPEVLDDVSFVADPGEFIALVGPSGSGKSTVMRLLLGFETPERGAIYYDRQDLATIDVSAVRSQLGVVLQSSRLIAGDVFTNIVGAAPLTQEDAWKAAEQAGLAEDVRAMPMQMQTVVSEGGTTLSGGQRQRLLIARALAREPRLIFFDEATSALDNRTQEIVSRSLERLRATRIVIAHRLSTIRHADRIYVLDRGRVVQQGNYDELMAQPGLFAQLVARQLA
jgi:NHLM bacteriocin system ABC transporter ATP-binding protein